MKIGKDLAETNELLCNQSPERLYKYKYCGRYLENNKTISFMIPSPGHVQLGIILGTLRM
jgi:hypothetical protein